MEKVAGETTLGGSDVHWSKGTMGTYSRAFATGTLQQTFLGVIQGFTALWFV